jgi:hypothetical protein
MWETRRRQYRFFFSLRNASPWQLVRRNLTKPISTWQVSRSSVPNFTTSGGNTPVETFLCSYAFLCVHVDCSSLVHKMSAPTASTIHITCKLLPGRMWWQLDLQSVIFNCGVVINFKQIWIVISCSLSELLSISCYTNHSPWYETSLLQYPVPLRPCVKEK